MHARQTTAEGEDRRRRRRRAVTDGGRRKEQVGPARAWAAVEREIMEAVSPRAVLLEHEAPSHFRNLTLV
ncbi:hypothetical protein GW17_00037783 [Ensete ventricosum]|nr:hypothetical protein GW17_00037783 [Ensete ventricosum]